MPTSPSQQLPLFVYGTLRRGEANFARYLEGTTLSIRPGTIRARLYLYPPGGYPFIVPGDGIVHGELIDVRPRLWPDVLAAIDELEDYDPRDENASWYLRRPVRVSTPDGEEVMAWTYFWNRPDLSGRLLAEGDWRLRTT